MQIAKDGLHTNLQARFENGMQYSCVITPPFQYHTSLLSTFVVSHSVYFRTKNECITDDEILLLPKYPIFAAEMMHFWEITTHCLNNLLLAVEYYCVCERTRPVQVFVSRYKILYLNTRYII